MTYHCAIHLIPLDSRNSECPVEVCEFHCRSGRAFVVDAIEKSSVNE